MHSLETTLGDRLDTDQHVRLHGITWDQFEAILEIRGEGTGVRIAYLEGELELMTPSRTHEHIKTAIGRLLEAWAEHAGIDIDGFGSWTVRSAPTLRGLEPDECYVIGSRETEIPDLAIEVVWTPGGIDKLEIYRGLGIREVWLWRNSQITVHVLGPTGYSAQGTSALLPELDLPMLARFAEERNQTQAVKKYRTALRAS